MAAANAYPTIHPLDHIEMLKNWQLDDRVRQIVQNISLYRFASSISTLRLDSELVSFLCDSYNTNDSSFHIREHRLYLGLEDIFYLTGLPSSH